MAKPKKKKSKLASNLSSKKSTNAPTKTGIAPVDRNNALKEIEPLQKQGLNKEAAVICAKMLEQDPNDPQFLYLLGSFMAQLGDNQRAISLLNKAIEMQPNFPEAYFNLGNILDAVKQFQQSCAAFQKAIEYKPDMIDAYHNLACILKKTFHGGAAIEMFRKVFELNPNHIKALYEAPSVLYGQGYHEEAYDALDRLYTLTKDPGVAISRDSIMSIIVPPKDEIPATREQFATTMDKYATSDLFIQEPQCGIRRASFHLAYHGLNNKELLKKQAAMFRHVSPHLVYTAPHCSRPDYYPKKDGKIRIGFVSKYFHEHSVSRCYNKMIEDIGGRDNCDVFLISTERLGIKDETIESIQTTVAGEINIPNNMEQGQKAVSDLKLDILIFTEIGMDQMSYCLALSRFAPIQAVLPGHPDTTGIDTVDYYLSCELAEPKENANDNYTEELLAFSDFIHIIEKTPYPDNVKTRAELNLPEDKNIYACPMKMMKIHPDFDIALRDILEKDKNGNILFFKDIGCIPDLLMERLKQTLNEEQMSRIIMAPWANKEDFKSYLIQSDLVLDPYYFGGGTTCYIILSLGTPMVTWPGPALTGRCADSCYTKMGFDDLVAKNFDDYVDIAVRVGTDKEYRSSLNEKILETCDVLFDTGHNIDELMSKLEEIAKEKGVIS